MNPEIMEKIDTLEEAADMIGQAADLIRSVFSDANTEAYLLNSLDHVASNSGNPYNLSIPQLIDRLYKDDGITDDDLALIRVK